MRRGYTLIEMMIVVAMLGISLSAAAVVWKSHDAPGRPGHDALWQDKATLALMNAHQVALATPTPVTAAPASLDAPAGMALTQHVQLLRPGVQRIDWVASWKGYGERVQTRRLSALKAVP